MRGVHFGAFLWEEQTALHSQLDMRDHADGQRGEERNCEQYTTCVHYHAEGHRDEERKNVEQYGRHAVPQRASRSMQVDLAWGWI